VTEEGFAAMTRSMRGVCAELEAPLGGVLEGGYALAALGRSVAATLQALSAAPRPAQLSRRRWTWPPRLAWPASGWSSAGPRWPL